MIRRPLKRAIKRKVKRKSKKGKTPKLSVLKRNLEALQKQLTIKKYGKDCYTCPQRTLTGSNCQLGHVPWPRSVLSTECKFSTDFTRIQCFRCNIHHGGMGAKALERMQQEGITVDDMWMRNEYSKGKVYPIQWFQDKITEYSNELRDL